MSPAATTNNAHASEPRKLKIDLHTHVLPRVWPDFEKKFGYPGWTSLEHGADPTRGTMMRDGKVFREINCNCWDDAARLGDCDRTDVDVQVRRMVNMSIFLYVHIYVCITSQLMDRLPRLLHQ